MQDSRYITVRGAKEHNLKNLTLKIPRDKLIVITGLSGSGKSTLAFDTIYAEGQRRYIESLSAYARQFLGQLNKPDIESIEGLSPSIAIEQKGISRNPRSTVGTITEIYDYLRVFFARLGTIRCYNCGESISSTSSEQIVNKILKIKPGTKFQIISPLISGRKGEYRELFESLRKKGFLRVRIDGKEKLLDEKIELDKNKKHNIDVIIDRIVMRGEIKTRVTDSVETALNLSNGLVLIDMINGSPKIYSEKLNCIKCNISYSEIEPRNFSFNSPYGACPECSGLGTEYLFDEDLIIPDKNKSISEGCLAPFRSTEGYFFNHIKSIAKYYNFNINTPYFKLSDEAKNILLYGAVERVPVEYNGKNLSYKINLKWEGVIPLLKRRYHQTGSENARDWYQKFMGITECESCKGYRLKKESLAVTIDGENIKNRNISEIVSEPIGRLFEYFNKISFSREKQNIAVQLLKEIKQRLKFLLDVGLDYLTLDRTASTLSSGESQRIRLASQIGSGLVGVLYVMDEPSIGLHQRDNKRLLDSLRYLRDIGNSVIIVEHDEETIRTADHIIDLGPGAGKKGGYVVAEGTPKQIEKCEKSLTGQYLTGTLKIDIPEKRRKPGKKNIKVCGAAEHNLKRIDVTFPVELFICVTGVSGAGKSTLVNDILHKALLRKLYKSSVKAGKHDRIEGLEYINKVINITQDPIGRTPRSNPATYTGVFTDIRNLFAKLNQAKIRGYKAGRFSFNVKGGRCEECDGKGVKKIEMHFLSDVYITCEVCGGKRFNSETLKVLYKKNNIFDILNMTVDESYIFFNKIPNIEHKLKTLIDVGLGYIKLGQSATTLSGGEAQRIKLSSELLKKSTSKTLYILDEPTTGLHFDDIKKLISVLNRLVQQGNTVIVIEHNLEVIKVADYIIDLGPEGGENGGTIVAQGTPEDISGIKKSYTGKYLKKILNKVKL